MPDDPTNGFELEDDAREAPQPTEDDSSAPAPVDERTDPQWWKRVLGDDPQASRIVNERDITSAIRGGRWLELYDALQKRRSDARSTAEREALAGVLGQRRLFVDAEATVPSTGTAFGCGVMMQGATDVSEEDGTYVRGRFFTLFYVPLVALDQHLVRDVGGGRIRYFGRVPMSRRFRLWRKGGALALVAAVLGLVAFAWYRQTHDDVHFINGLDVPVVVEVGDVRVELPPGGRVVRELSSGRQHLVTRLTDGRLVEELDVEVHGDADFSGYSVLGAAPVYKAQIAYYAKGQERYGMNDPSRVDSLAGSPWMVVGKVDFLFEPEAKTLQTRDARGLETRVRVDMAPGGWAVSLVPRLREGKLAEVAALARKIAELEPEVDKAFLTAQALTMQGADLPTLRRFLDRMLELAPGSVEVHRGHQDCEVRRGHADALRAHYEAAWRKAPDDPQAAYLYARLLPADEALQLAGPFLASHPDDPWFHILAAWAHETQGRYAAATPHVERLRALVPQEAGVYTVRLAELAAGRGDLAAGRREIQRFLEAAEERRAAEQDALLGSELHQVLGVYAVLLRDEPVARRLRVLRKWGDPYFEDGTLPAAYLAGALAYARDREGLQSVQWELEPYDRLRCNLAVLSREDPWKAAQEALGADAAVLADLDDAALIVIASELVGAGERDKAEILFLSLAPYTRRELRLSHLEALPDTASLPSDLQNDVHAALLVAAARRSEAGDAREALLSQARKLDALRRVVP